MENLDSEGNTIGMASIEEKKMDLTASKLAGFFQVNLLPFDGESKSSVDQFIRKVEQAAKAGGVTDEEIVATAASSQLMGVAANWYENAWVENEEQLRKWSTMKEMLRKRFKKGRTVAEKNKIIRALTMKTDEQPINFFTRCETLRKDLEEGLPYKDCTNCRQRHYQSIMELFLWGLDKSIIQKLDDREFASDEEYVRAAQQVFLAREASKTQRTAVISEQETIAVITNKQKGKNKKMGQFGQKTAENKASKKFAMFGANQNAQGQWQCRFCKEWTDEEGHVAWNCPKRKNNKKKEVGAVTSPMAKTETLQDLLNKNGFLN